MKTTLANPAMNKVVKDFLSNPAAAFPTTVVKNKLTGLDEVKPHGWTQRQQALCLLTCLREAGLMVIADDAAQQQKDFVEALTLIYDQANGSASRQTMEGANMLAKTEGKTRGVDVAELAAKFLPPAPAAEPAS